ncbi:MAG: DUF2749 domain-containing protein [Clostridia bacterium]|nr:DUF2749 domain-containing protein [Clostridia bacterium]
MQPIDIIILIVAVAIVGGVIAWQIIRKKQGKGGCCESASCSACSGRCGSCGGCQSCSTKEDEKQE